MNRSNLMLLALLVLNLLSGCSGHIAQQVTSDVLLPANTPVSSRDFLNNAQNFQFVVVGDRTGGHRPGVFRNAMQQINLLQPEFVVSVGDLIEGYVDDPVVVDRQWHELEQSIEQLEMPFFYVVGNHDISNLMMRDTWLQRRGADYYYFVYRNVLFLVLNTEDPPVRLSESALAGSRRIEAGMLTDPEGTQRRLLERFAASPPAKLPGKVAISQQQVDYFTTVLREHKEVRWTFVMMHKPAWEYNSREFEAIEKLLEDRDYTVFAGHEHYYKYSQRHGRDYIDMATTGGVWLKDGAGRADHIAWVTMTEEGPRIANIKLEGLSDLKAMSD